MQMAPAGLPTADSWMAVGVRERRWEVGLGLSPGQLNSSGITSLPLANSGIWSQAAHCPWAQRVRGDTTGDTSLAQPPALKAATAPCSSFMEDSKLICKLFPKSGMDQRRLPLENLLLWLSLWDTQSLFFHLTLPPPQHPPAGLEQLHGTQSLSCPFFIFSSSIWPSSCSLAGCQDSFILIPGTPGHVPGRPSPGKCLCHGQHW